MKRTNAPGSERGSTVVEVLVALVFMTFVFLFITASLIQSTGAQNFASNHSQTITAANQLFSVMKQDGLFWSPDWASGPRGGTLLDACGKLYPPYTDSLTSPTWHPLCTSDFPELTGGGVQAQYMWNAQIQGGDANTAQLTLWVMTDEGSRHDLYELHGTRMQTAPLPNHSGVLPTQPPSPPTSPSPSVSSLPTKTPSPKPKPSPTSTPSPTPKPSPTPTGMFE